MQHFVQQHNFAVTPNLNIPRSVFNRSCGNKGTFNSGYLVPFFVDEALPGDTMNLTHSLLVRMLSPLDQPLMDNMWLETFYFAVPYRLVWNNWQKFHGEQENPGDSTDFLCPTITSGENGFAVHSLADYFGIVTGIPNITVDSFWHRAYNLIYNEWFRDENLIDSAVVDKDDGPDDESDYPLRRRGKRHDYFTSCLPWPQKGVAVELPLGTSAPVVGNGTSLTFTDGDDNVPLIIKTTGGSSVASGAGVSISSPLPVNQSISGGNNTPLNGNVGIGVTTNPDLSGLVADLSSATAATINSLRQAFAFQTLFERDARGGTRYIEIIRSHFGVISPDSRLQRPEYLGGTSDRIDTPTVVQNSETSNNGSLGELASFGVCSTIKHGFIKSFTEHCLIIGLLNVRADLTYQQGIPRMFSRQSRFDFYYPALANLGEQAVLNKEIYAQGTSVDDEVFGYQERWSEYRYKPSQICGYLRSTVPQSLDVWHLSQKFDSLPTLSETFINENPPIDRVLSVQDNENIAPQFIFDAYFKLIHARPMPVFSIPSIGRYA